MQSMVNWIEDRNHDERHGRKKLLRSWWLGSRAREKCQEGRSKGLDIDPRAIPSWPNQTPPGVDSRNPSVQPQSQPRWNSTLITADPNKDLSHISLSIFLNYNHHTIFQYDMNNILLPNITLIPSGYIKIHLQLHIHL